MASEEYEVKLRVKLANAETINRNLRARYDDICVGLGVSPPAAGVEISNQFARELGEHAVELRKKKTIFLARLRTLDPLFQVLQEWHNLAIEAAAAEDQVEGLRTQEMLNQHTVRILDQTQILMKTLASHGKSWSIQPGQTLDHDPTPKAS